MSLVNKNISVIYLPLGTFLHMWFRLFIQNYLLNDEFRYRKIKPAILTDAMLNS